MERQRVHATVEFARQRRIDHAVAVDSALSPEGLRHNIDPEMRLAAGPVAGMPLMLMGFVLDPQALRFESLGQLLCDDVTGVHPNGLAMVPATGQSPALNPAEPRACHSVLSSLRAPPWRPHNGRS